MSSAARPSRLARSRASEPWAVNPGCPLLTRAVHLDNGERAGIQVGRASQNDTGRTLSNGAGVHVADVGRGGDRATMPEALDDADDGLFGELGVPQESPLAFAEA